MKYATIFFFMLSLLNCAGVIEKQSVIVYLQPVHTVTTGFNEGDYVSVELIDNDGNMYITYWDVMDEKITEFNLSIKECRENIRSNKLHNKAIEVSDIKASDIKPSLFKKFNSCILSKHYEHKYSDAFSPTKYKLSIIRSISSAGEYMPVGAKYYVTKNGVKYRDVLVDVKECELIINKTEKQGIYEIHSVNYSHVSIEGYASNMTSCLRKRNYLFDSDNIETKENAVNINREEEALFDKINNVLRK